MDTRQMIDEAVRKMGGRFKLTVLLQKRIQELNKGAQKVIETEATSLLDVALQEILSGKISLTAEEEPKLSS